MRKEHTFRYEDSLFALSKFSLILHLFYPLEYLGRNVVWHHLSIYLFVYSFTYLLKSIMATLSYYSLFSIFLMYLRCLLMVSKGWFYLAVCRVCLLFDISRFFLMLSNVRLSWNDSFLLPLLWPTTKSRPFCYNYNFKHVWIRHQCTHRDLVERQSSAARLGWNTWLSINLQKCQRQKRRWSWFLY